MVDCTVLLRNRVGPADNSALFPYVAESDHLILENALNADTGSANQVLSLISSLATVKYENRETRQ